jgi:acyl-CoA thioester hydrolase
VRFPECDPYGIVYVANYLVYLDVAVQGMMRAVLGRSNISNLGVHPVVAEATLGLFGSATFDDELDLDIAVVRLGRTSISLRMIVNRSEQQIAAVELRLVFVDAATKRKAEIPPILAQALQPYIAPASPDGLGPTSDSEGTAKGGDG